MLCGVMARLGAFVRGLPRRVAALVSIVFQPVHLRRTGLIALAVGTWITLVNHGDELVLGHWTWTLLPKIALNYLTPFTTSNLGLLSRTAHHQAEPATVAPRASAEQ